MYIYPVKGFLNTTKNAGKSPFFPFYRFSFNGKESDNEVKGTGNSLDFGARIYDPRLGRWLSVDPLQSKYPELAPYNFSADNPILFIDEGGKYIRLSFESKKARNAYLKLVNSTLEGQFEVKLKLRTDDRLGYYWEVTLIPKGGDLSKLSEKGKAFYEEYSKVINDKHIVRQEVVFDDKETVVGNFKTNKIDIGDIQKFDEAGPGGASSAGALIHETKEQLEKRKHDLDPGEWSKSVSEHEISPELSDSHLKGIAAENHVNGNKRISITEFIEKDGSTTIQEIPDSGEEFKVNKTNPK